MSNIENKWSRVVIEARRVTELLIWAYVVAVPVTAIALFAGFMTAIGVVVVSGSAGLGAGVLMVATLVAGWAATMLVVKFFGESLENVIASLSSRVRRAGGEKRA